MVAPYGERAPRSHLDLRSLSSTHHVSDDVQPPQRTQQHYAQIFSQHSHISVFGEAVENIFGEGGIQEPIPGCPLLHHAGLTLVPVRPANACPVGVDECAKYQVSTERALVFSSRWSTSAASKQVTHGKRLDQHDDSLEHGIWFRPPLVVIVPLGRDHTINQSAGFKGMGGDFELREVLRSMNRERIPWGVVTINRPSNIKPSVGQTG